MKNWVDILFVFAGLFSIVRGWRAGFLAMLLGFIGYFGGGLAGLALGLHFFKSVGFTKFALLFLAVTIGSAIGEALFNRIGKLLHTKILFAPFTWIDSVLGAAFSLLRTTLMLVILGHLLLITPWHWAQVNIPASKIYREINQRTPSLIQTITTKAKSQIHN